MSYLPSWIPGAGIKRRFTDRKPVVRELQMATHTLMEKEEGERFDVAKRNIVAETDRLRGTLIEKEKELERLKKEVEMMSNA